MVPVEFTSISRRKFIVAEARLSRQSLGYPLELPARMCFKLGEHRYRAEVSAREGGGARFKLTASLGHLPFSAEDGDRRGSAIDWMERARKVLPGTFRFDDRGRLRVEQVTNVDYRPNAIDFLAISVQLLFVLMPHFLGAVELLISAEENLPSDKA